MENLQAPEAPIIRCPICDDTFSRNFTMKRHMVRIHGYTYEEYIAHNSNNITYNSNDITHNSKQLSHNSHLNIETITSKEYKCTKCFKCLYTNWYLKKHMKKCKGIKDNLSCEYCHKLFSHGRSRFGHYKICEIKNKKEDDISNLNEEVEEKTNIIEDIPKESIGIIKKKKQAISATIKRLVWNTHIGEEIGKSKCLCCKVTDITQLSFNCGHIIAEANNGKTIVSNLKPICQNCNSSMGTKNMDDFMKTLM